MVQIWFTKEEDLLVEGFEIEVKNGFQAESGWKPATIERVRLHVNAQVTYVFRTQQIKDHFGHLKKDWKEIKYLRSLSGFGWDMETQQVTASEAVFNAWTEVSSIAHVSSSSFVLTINPRPMTKRIGTAPSHSPSMTAWMQCVQR
jgi:hypothetical protein